MAIVDIHCHTFNADDLPVRGFVRRVAGSRNALARVLAGALDSIIQDRAVDAADEIATLDALLSGEGVGGGEETVREDVTAVAEAEADLLLARATAETPADVTEAVAELRTEAPEGTDEGLEGILDPLATLRRYLKWAALFGHRRLALTQALVRTYPEVDLFTPLLVDLLGLEDAPKSTVLQQLDINEKISRLSMRGDLGATVHPFVGFDPRRLGAVALAQQAVDRFSCVGVKLYPPMGFRPIGNLTARPRNMTAEEAIGVDAALAQLYDWCQDQDVPITAHSNPSNQADDSFLGFSGPASWKLVLDRWPDLHLNFGHFGWGGLEQGWPRAICELANDHRHVYADVGNHKVAGLDETFRTLVGLFADASPTTRTMKQRFMFGTDWYMAASQAGYERFLDALRDTYQARFDTGLDRFLGGAALSFLGFDDPANHNNRRLHARYQAHRFAPPPWLA
jgi:predicted TIM-barrel fold metal-dependent hydrolase